MDNERYVICRNKGEVAVLDFGHDLVEEEGSAELFNLDFVNESDAIYVANELEFIVRELNYKDKELKSMKERL